jgi:hypothetical protein
MREPRQYRERGCGQGFFVVWALVGAPGRPAGVVLAEPAGSPARSARQARLDDREEVLPKIFEIFCLTPGDALRAVALVDA